MTRKSLKNNAPGEIRTPDHLVRSLVLERSYLTVFVPKIAALLGNIFRSFCALSVCFYVTRPVLFPSLSLEKRPNFVRRNLGASAYCSTSAFWHRRVLTTLIVLAFTSGCAHNDEWTRRDTVLQVGVTAFILADAITTAKIQDRPDLVEGNPVGHILLGPNPSSRDTYMYLGTWAISNYLISRALPERWRKYWQSLAILGHGSAVVNNCDADLC